MKKPHVSGGGKVSNSEYEILERFDSPMGSTYLVKCDDGSVIMISEDQLESVDEQDEKRKKGARV